MFAATRADVIQAPNRSFDKTRWNDKKASTEIQRSLFIYCHKYDRTKKNAFKLSGAAL
jgi:hypothetical protein